MLENEEPRATLDTMSERRRKIERVYVKGENGVGRSELASFRNPVVTGIEADILSTKPRTSRPGFLKKKKIKPWACTSGP